jgi:hypothetical protein
LGLSGPVPPRVDQATKSGLLDLPCQPPRPAGPCEPPARRSRSASCASTGGFTAEPPANSPPTRPVAARCTACWTGWPGRDRAAVRRLGRGRPLAPQARPPRLVSGPGVGLTGQRAPGAGAPGPAGAAAASARPDGPQAVPGLGGVPTRVDLDLRHHPFTRAGVAATVVGDLVGRKWLAEIVSVEERSTQVRVVLCEALEREGWPSWSVPARTGWSTSPWTTRPGRCCSPSASIANSETGQRSVLAGGRDRDRTCDFCRVKGARPPHAASRTHALLYIVAAQRP